MASYDVVAFVEADCPRHRAHLPIVYYRRRARDLWMKSYWVECAHCGLRLGPYPPSLAVLTQAGINTYYEEKTLWRPDGSA